MPNSLSILVIFWQGQMLIYDVRYRSLDIDNFSRRKTKRIIQNSENQVAKSYDGHTCMWTDIAFLKGINILKVLHFLHFKILKFPSYRVPKFVCCNRAVFQTNRNRRLNFDKHVYFASSRLSS